MLDLFKRKNLKDLPIYSVRGNHDAYFNWTAEIELGLKQDQWIFPSLYYSKFIKIGDSEDLVAFLFIDSILLLCADDYS